MSSIGNARSVSSKQKVTNEQNLTQNLYEKIFDFSNDTIGLFFQDFILGISFFIAEILFSIHNHKD
jgi:ABC-type lipoprotein export system ATPase subunit